MSGLGRIEELNGLIRKENVRWIHLHFTDVPGFLMSFTVPAPEFTEGDAWTEGVGFDGSSIKGYKSIESSDMVAKPDPSTFSIIPWTDGVQKSARVICDIHEAFREGRFEGDPRHCAQRAMKELEGDGYTTAVFGPEIEFFVFSSFDPSRLTFDLWGSGEGAPPNVRIVPSFPEVSIGNYLVLPKCGYFQPPPIDRTNDYRNEMSDALWRMGVNVECTHHEVATAGQLELDFKPFGVTPYGAKVLNDAVRCGDAVMTYKYAARNIAAKHGFLATFMPKPLFADNASGMHTHISLWRGAPPDGENVFYDPDDGYAEISQTARYFIGGQIEHARATCAVVAPTVNSYRRLVPGFEAPIYVMWSRRNRSAFVRIPVYHKGRRMAHAKRIEIRHPDPSCNPYLAFAVLLAAGLDGIRRKIDPGDPVDKDVYRLTREERGRYGVGELPTSLREALDELSTDDVVQRALGSHIYDAFMELKTEEWNMSCAYVSPLDYLLYFNV